MKYFDAFSGYGGFSLGIQKAYVLRNNSDNSRELQTEGKLSPEGENTKSKNSKSGEYVVQSAPVVSCIGYSEIDKYATQIYKKHFPTHKPYGDIKTIDPRNLPDFDLLVGGFPCQAFSIAGKRGGFEDTRGTLIYDVFRIIKEKHPRIVLLENVKGLLSHDSGNTFKTIITSLAELGYAVEWQVLNAKNFGVPQNRERVFIIGHLGGFGGRKVFPIRQTYREDIESDVFVRAVLTPDRLNKRQNGRRMKNDGEPMFTLNAQDKHGVFVGSQIRRITPTECERLMGLPDGWTEGVSDTQRYKLCGNGVVVNVVEEIIKKLFY